MKTISEIASLVKEEFNSWKYGGEYFGLCEVVENLTLAGLLNTEEKKLFMDELKKVYQRKKYVYIYGMDKQIRVERKTARFTDCFLWVPEKIKPRIKFLDKLIEKE